MTLGDLCRRVKADWRAHGQDWTKPGFRTIAAYRFGVWRMGVRQPFRAPLSVLYGWAFRWCRNIYGIELPYTATVGIDVVIEHQGGIVVHGSTVIGDRCIIRQNCTLGVRSLDRLQDAPVLMADVNVGAGAVILGRVTIGAGAAIGANAVVLTDVPAGALAVGVPATIRLRAVPDAPGVSLPG
ncbi:serine acetyltransferase [Sphingomonas sp. Leaf339]|uniref:serine O-acetyltransferase n=1 Tax=Sphingomonas sp. Leaf339 TaxID=1736343 RepID=UPI0006F7DF92|nr:serine acetyltransferase [Sphingomonas sp. Leaf339]KQU62044.1 serine acetyltransferase [Sphingomonas sp. Leaf339]